MEQNVNAAPWLHSPCQADSLGTGSSEHPEGMTSVGGVQGGLTPQDVLVDLGGLPLCGVLGAVRVTHSQSSHISCVQAYLRSDFLGSAVED